MTICQSCGHDSPADRDFCVNCGAYLRWEETTQWSADPDAPEPEPSQADAPTQVIAPDELEEGPAPEPEPAPAPPAPEDAVLVMLRSPGEGGGDEPAVARADAGGQAALVGLVRNQTGIVDNYDLRLIGLPEGWWTIEPATVYLTPYGAEGGVHEQEVALRLHPPRSPEAEARSWPIQLVARSRVSGDEATSATATLEIAPYVQFETRLRPERVSGERRARLNVPVRNLGNAPLEVSFRGEDAEGEMEFSFEPPTLTLPPGGEGRAMATAWAPQAWSGSERERRLTVYVTAGGQELSDQALFVQKPRVTGRERSWWRILLIVLGAALLIVGSFLDWLDGVRGVCLDDSQACLSYDAYVERAFPPEELSHPDVPSGVQGLVDFVTSIGMLTILLGVLVLAGIRTGALAWSAGLLAIIAIVVFFVTIEDASGPGAWIALAGGVCAVVGGILSTRRATT